MTQQFTFSDQVQPENFLPLIIGSLKKPVMKFFEGEKRLGKRKFLKEADIFTEQNIDRILNMPFMPGMDKVYEAIDRKYSAEEMKALEKNQGIKHEIGWMLNMLSRAAKAGIPKNYAMGVIAVYVELVMGKNVAEPEPEPEEVAAA